MTLRTTTHSYPTEELDAMVTFYGGKRSVITQQTVSVQWAHILDADLDSTNSRLEWMLSRKLRQDRHPRHAAEVRENLVPVNADAHMQMDSRPATASLVLHEDLLMRTLHFELEYQAWRLSELHAGRGDPGRPAYEYAFKVFAPTRHRWHSTTPVAVLAPLKFYHPIDCPGVYPDSGNSFPEIDTLLSIPFSILHNTPRLMSMVPLSQYQADLIVMSTRIIELWSWDPLSNQLALAQAASTNAAPLPKPKPIQDPSRENTVYQYSPVSLPQILSPTNTSLPVHLSTSGDSITASELTGSSEEDEKEEKAKDTQPPALSSLDILDWLNHVENGTTSQYSPLPPTSFKKGDIACMTVNDILMIQGLIDPGVYIQFLDLSSFS